MPKRGADDGMWRMCYPIELSSLSRALARDMPVSAAILVIACSRAALTLQLLRRCLKSYTVGLLGYE